MLFRLGNSRPKAAKWACCFHPSVSANRREAAAFKAGIRQPASSTICSIPFAIASPFDGNWSVVAQTTQGHCGSMRFGLAINHGRLYSAGGYYVFGYPAQLGGRVSPSGYLIMVHE